MKLKKSDAPASFIIEQGMVSPRDETIGWRFWEECVSLDDAKKKLQPVKYGIWRIVEMRERLIS